MMVVSFSGEAVVLYLWSTWYAQVQEVPQGAEHAKGQEGVQQLHCFKLMGA
jgi:hypothetical protein